MNVSEFFGDLVFRNETLSHDHVVSVSAPVPSSRVLLLPATYGVDEADLVIMASQEEPPVTATPRQIMLLQSDDLFALLFAGQFAARFPSAPQMARASDGERFLGRRVAALELIAGVAGNELMPHALSAAVLSLRALASISDTDVVAAKQWALLLQVRGRETPSTRSIAYSMAHRGPFVLPNELQTILAAALDLVRGKARMLLEAVQITLGNLQTSCNCSAALVLAPAARVDAESMLAQLRAAIPSASHVTVKNTDPVPVHFSRRPRAPIEAPLRPRRRRRSVPAPRIALPVNATPVLISMNK